MERFGGFNVTLNDNVTLLGDTTFTSYTPNSANVTFTQKVDGGFNLTVNANTTTFGGSIGATTP